MARLLAWWALAPVLGACATYWPTLEGRSPTAAAAAYRCADSAASALGFAHTVGAERTRSFEARRYDERASNLLGMERRQFDVLSVELRPADTAATNLRVRAETVVRRITREGWVEEGAPASPGAQRAARELLARCAPGVTPGRSP
ncbi:MAG TPA: hypothetical protein VFS44_08200 [Gemmatimonadaceae bacterium]|nr:hypothetical protein [Gemmatimonadaceae bacterium]